uniref:Uncharacterized protein n=1 Tax=Callithrix jacchus TaxID=9483 RepID=A0A8I4A2S5_CALJA
MGIAHVALQTSLFSNSFFSGARSLPGLGPSCWTRFPGSRSVHNNSDSLCLLPRLEHSGIITARCSLSLAGSGDPPISVSQVAGTTGMCLHVQVIFVFFVEIGFHHVSQAVLKLRGSSDPPTSTSQIS